MKNLVIAILTLTIVACSTEAEKEGLLEQDKFESMMYEVHLADALLKHKNMSDRKLKNFNESYYNHIFLKYGLSPSEFERNVRYYSQNTETYKEMYKRILNRLDDEKDLLQQVDTIIKKPKLLNEPK